MNKPDITAVLFDLDGTLVDTAIDMIQALETLAQQHGIERSLPVADYRQYISKGAAALVQALFPELEQGDKEALRQEYLTIYQKQLNQNNQLFDGIPELLQTLQEQNIPWGIVTNKPSWLTNPLVAAIDAFNHAQVVISADEVGIAKPNPKPLLAAAEQMNIDPATTLYLGDAESDITAANAAGMVSAIAMWGYIAPDDQPNQWPAALTLDSAHELLIRI